MRTDALFFRIFQELPACYFEAIGADAAVANEYTFKSEELKQAGLRIDGVFLPKKVGRPVHFVEVYFYPSANAYSNLFAKVFLWLETKNPAQDWHASLFFASRKLDVADPRPYRNLVGTDQVSRVYLAELPEAAGNQLGLGILGMIVSTPRRALAKAKVMLERLGGSKTIEADTRKVVELIERVVLGHFPDLGWEELATMLQIRDFRETRAYREAKEDGLEQGRIEIAERLLQRKHSLDEIVAVTGLPAKQVEKLRKKLGKRKP